MTYVFLQSTCIHTPVWNYGLCVYKMYYTYQAWSKEEIDALQ